MEKFLDILYWTSIVVWIACSFIAICFGEILPMWIALIVMNVTNFVRIMYE